MDFSANWAGYSSTKRHLRHSLVASEKLIAQVGRRKSYNGENNYCDHNDRKIFSGKIPKTFHFPSPPFSLKKNPDIFSTLTNNNQKIDDKKTSMEIDAYLEISKLSYEVNRFNPAIA